MTGDYPLADHYPAAEKTVAGYASARGGRYSRIGPVVTAFLLAAGVPALAQQAPATESSPAPAAPPARTIGTASATEVCVEVDISGYRAGHLDCATQRLQAATREAQERAPNADSFEVPGTRSADVVTGIANQTATRQRMGSQFGVGVRPQRPPPPVYAPPPMGPRKP